MIRRFFDATRNENTMPIRTAPRTLTLNAICNVLSFAAQMAVALVLAPRVIAALGAQRYGLWSVLESLLMYLALCDLGFASAVVRFLPQRIAVADADGASRLLSTALAFFTGMAALVILALTLFLASARPWLAELMSAPQAHEFVTVLAIMVGYFALSLVTSTFAATLDGLGQYAAKSVARTTALVLRVPLTVLAVHRDQPLIGLALATAGTNALEQFVLVVLARRALPQVALSPGRVDAATFRQIFGYSWNSFVALIAGRLAFHTDAFVIGPNLGAAAIGHFAIAAKLVETAKTALRQATTTLTYAFSSLDAQNEPAAVRRIFLGATRAVLYIILPVQAGMYLLGHDFLRLWVGEKYTALSWPTLQILALPLGLTMAQSVASRLLYGLGRLRGFARLSLAEGVCNLLLSLALVQPLGVAGVAWGTAVPHVGLCFATLVIALRATAMTWRTYLENAVRPIIAVGTAALIWASVRAAHPPIGWADFVGVGLLGVIAHVMTLALLERQLIRTQWSHWRLRLARTSLS